MTAPRRQARPCLLVAVFPCALALLCHSLRSLQTPHLRAGTAGSASFPLLRWDALAPGKARTATDGPGAQSLTRTATAR